YSFPQDSTSTEVYSNITSWEKDENTGEPIITGDSVTITSDHIDGTSFLDATHPAINGNYDDNIYQFDSPTIGGEGPFLKYQIFRQTENKNEVYDYRFFKDE